MPGGVVKRRGAVVVCVAVGLLIAVTCVACASGGPEWVDEGRTLTLDEARAVLNEVDAETLAEQPVEGSDELRQEALASLRAQGEEAAEAADLVTATFPAQTRAVPFYVERAIVEERPVIIMVEAWGPREGRLDLERIWIIESESGNVLDSSSVE